MVSRNSLGRLQNRTIENRFWEKVNKNSSTLECHAGIGLCWIWTGAHLKDGYGEIFFNGQIVLAHRTSWELHYGVIPKEMQVLHRCDNPPCVRPDHLFLGTNHDNVLDSVSKGRRAKINSKKTHCPQGHPYNTENTYWSQKNHRYCRICLKLNWAKTNKKRKLQRITQKKGDHANALSS